MWLAPLLFAVGLAQGPASFAPPPASPRPPPATADADPRSVEELVVTAPKQQKPEPPMYGVLTGAAGRQFKAEAARKEQMRRYRDTGSMKDYPGIRCAVFHRC